MLGVSARNDLLDSSLFTQADVPISDRFPLLTAARTTKTGLYCGLAFGLAQDALGFARGRRLDYVDSLIGRPQKSSEEKGMAT